MEQQIFVAGASKDAKPKQSQRSQCYQNAWKCQELTGWVQLVLSWEHLGGAILTFLELSESQPEDATNSACRPFNALRSALQTASACSVCSDSEKKSTDV